MLSFQQTSYFNVLIQGDTQLAEGRREICLYFEWQQQIKKYFLPLAGTEHLMHTAQVKERSVTVCVFDCRHHHCIDHVHHHHRRQCLHATGLLHQGGGHLPLGQLRLCLPVGDRVCGGQLPLHRTGKEREETEGESKWPLLCLLCL